MGRAEIREKLRRLHQEISLPAISTVHAVLDRHGLVSSSRKRRYKSEGTALSSPRSYQGLTDLEYPFHDRAITVTTCGCICIGRRKINLSVVFAGQSVGIKEIAEKIWLVTFMEYDLGFPGGWNAQRIPSLLKCYPSLPE